jgi:sugar phosphate isomerase/epimerase
VRHFGVHQDHKDADAMKITTPLAVQLYTIRELTAKDFAGTLKEVRDAGYGAVEFAGHGGLGAKELRQLLSDLGLEAAGSHVGIDALGADFGTTADFHEEIGCRNLVVSGPPGGFERTAAGWSDLGRRLGEAAPRCAARGFKLAYHNHDFEFQPFDGRTGHELLFAAAGEGVGAQVDTYWVQFAGGNPAALIRRMRGQVHSLHLKDMSAGPERHDVEVGEGILDWAGILEAGAVAGAGWYIVEQDECRNPHIQSIRTSAANLRKMGVLAD